MPSVDPFEHRGQNRPLRRSEGPTPFDEIVESPVTMVRVVTNPTTVSWRSWSSRRRPAPT